MDRAAIKQAIAEIKSHKLPKLISTFSNESQCPTPTLQLESSDLAQFTKTKVFPTCRLLWEDLLDNEILEKLQSVVQVTNYTFPASFTNGGGGGAPLLLIYNFAICLVKAEFDLLQVFKEQDEDQSELEMNEISYVNSDQIVGLMNDIIDGTEYTSADEIPTPVSSLQPNVELLWKCWRELDTKITTEQKLLMKKEWLDLINSTVLLLETDTAELSKDTCTFLHANGSGYKFILECYQQLTSKDQLNPEIRDDIVFKRLLTAFGLGTAVLKSIVQLDQMKTEDEVEFKHNLISRAVLLDKLSVQDAFNNSMIDLEKALIDFKWAAMKLQRKYGDDSGLVSYLNSAATVVKGQIQFLTNH